MYASPKLILNKQWKIYKIFYTQQISDHKKKKRFTDKMMSVS